MRDTRFSRPCDFCGAIYVSAPYLVKQGRATCSRQCAYALRARKFREKLERSIGCDLGKWLRKRYLVDKTGVREIGAELGVNVSRGVAALLRHYAIPVRYGSEAVASQWVDAADRKRRQATHMSGIGKATGQRYLRGLAIPPSEIVARAWLRAAGIKYVGQYDPRPRRGEGAGVMRHIDIYLPEFRVGIEVYGSGSQLRRAPGRHRALTKLGVRMFYIPNRVFLEDKRQMFEQFVAGLQRLRLDPRATPGPELVRWRHPNDSAIGQV